MPFGVYHLTNAGSCSWYEFAKTIVTLTGHTQYEVKPIPYSALGRPALRPAYSALANHHWLTTTGQLLRGWQEALVEVLSAWPLPLASSPPQ
jgi:dTDP-4-dehydrorhamnose reductase